MIAGILIFIGYAYTLGLMLLFGGKPKPSDLDR